MNPSVLAELVKRFGSLTREGVENLQDHHGGAFDTDFVEGASVDFEAPLPANPFSRSNSGKEPFH